MVHLIVTLMLLLAARDSIASKSNSTCSVFSDCGSCADKTVLGAHACHWCEVDQQCHDLGSPVSACAPSMESDRCVSKSSSSTCLKTCPSPLDAYRPRHLHLALAGRTGMRVAWKTRSPPKQGCSVSVTRSGQSGGIAVASDGYKQYLVGHGYHHVTTLRNLSPGEYSYTATCDEASSEVRSFRIPQADLDRASILVIGDMGTEENGQAVASKKRIDALKASTDLAVHVGDIGYADDSFLHPSCSAYFCYEAVNDQYMQWMEDVMDTKPYMVVPGNHESECHAVTCLTNPVLEESLRNFSAFNTRWHMPSAESGGVLNMWYSFNYGPIHFVAANTETDFPNAGPTGLLPNGHFAPDGEYLRWLEADLAAANANRVERPWIVAMGHRTWIHEAGQLVEEATGKAHKELFAKYGVDLYLAGHQHSYSRQFPMDSSTASPPVVVTGAAGCDEGLEGWGQVNGTANGYHYWGTGKVHQVGTLEASRSTLTWKAHNSETGEVFDTFTLQAHSSSIVV